MRGEANISDIVLELEENNLLPAIIFRTARAQCDQDVQYANSNRAIRLGPERRKELQENVERVIASYELERDLITTHPHYPALLATGIGAHHAGQLLMWRLLLEELMSAGVLRVLVATGTVAAGVDFPARTVVITAHSRRGSEGFASLTAAEFQQMSGRAGRRGKDTVGFCLAAPAPFCDARAILRISKQPPEPLKSAYFPGPSTVLNLLRYRNVDDLRYTVEQSLASFIDRKNAAKELEIAAQAESELPESVRKALQVAVDEEDEDSDSAQASPGKPLSREQKKMVKRVRRLKRQASALERRQIVLLDSALHGLRDLGYLERTSLSEKGYWAANLCTSLVLELGEIIESGMLAQASAERLAAIVASISGDEYRRYLDSKNSPLDKADLEKINEILTRVGLTTMPGISHERKVVPAAAYTVLTWMHAESWHEFRSILLLSGVAEGDAARLITQTAEHLNQLTRLSATHPELSLRAEEARRRILRPPLTEVINLETV